MAITIKTPGIHHISLRVSDFARARRFYVDTLGFQLIMEMPDLFLFFAGITAIGIRPAQESGGFNPFRVGMDHLALACEDEAELERVAAALSKAGIENTGVKIDETLGKKYVAFKDPDRIAWELYMK
jgi:catechol 2,3-dioxygenase-like lactoylglutathione lyase family enzyme